MLDINFIRENTETVRKMLHDRQSDADVERLLETDNQRRDLLNRIEILRHEKKESSRKIGEMKHRGAVDEALMKAASGIGDEIQRLEELHRTVDAEYDSLILAFPNIPHETVPVGKDDSFNRVERAWGEKPSFAFTVKPHDVIAEDLGIVDFKRAGKITGSRFATYVGLGARLERALINFMLDVQTMENGYIEMLPPFIVNSKALTGTGQLPKFEADLFRLDFRDYYLIPTAEVPLTNHYADEILPADRLPVKMTAFTPCFRSEAGSYGQDVKGLIRLHQFNKVELVMLCHPDESWKQLEELTDNAEAILRKLNLHYRVVTLSTGDMGFSSAKTYDLEVWLPSEGKYREISSCSNFTDFQARRASIRFKDPETGKNRFVHTLNGSGLAVGRTVVAILENYQDSEGRVIVPEALRPYMDGKELISGII
jgi:seryl-tRNA synthetase